MKLEVGLRAALRAFIGPVAYCSAPPATLSGPCCTCLPIAREFLTPCPFHRSKPTPSVHQALHRRPSFRIATLHQRKSRHRRRPSAAAKPQSRRSRSSSRKAAARQQISRRHAAERPPSRSRKAAALRGGPRPSARSPLRRRPRRRRAERGQRGRTPKALGLYRVTARDGAAGGSGQQLEGTGPGWCRPPASTPRPP